MYFFSPSGHREALEPHSLSLIQSMFAALKGKGMEERGTDPFGLCWINSSVRERWNPFNHTWTRNTFSCTEPEQQTLFFRSPKLHILLDDMPYLYSEWLIMLCEIIPITWVNNLELNYTPHKKINGSLRCWNNCELNTEMLSHYNVLFCKEGIRKQTSSGSLCFKWMYQQRWQMAK